MVGNEFISPDPDYMEESAEEVGGESFDSFEFEEPLELSNAERRLQGCRLVMFTMLCMLSNLLTPK